MTNTVYHFIYEISYLGGLIKVKKDYEITMEKILKITNLSQLHEVEKFIKEKHKYSTKVKIIFYKELREVEELINETIS